jgi:hypothetical protein
MFYQSNFNIKIEFFMGVIIFGLCRSKTVFNLFHDLKKRDNKLQKRRCPKPQQVQSGECSNVAKVRNLITPCPFFTQNMFFFLS